MIRGIPDSLSCIPDSKAHDFTFHKQNYLIVSREDKGDREGIPHTHPIPKVIRLELFLESG